MDTLLWYLARSAGMVSWACLVLSVVIGALAAGRVGRRAPLTRWLLDLHPFLAGLGLGALGVHLGAAVLDTQSKLGWLDVVVPFHATWAPAAMSWGVLGVWCLAIVEATSLLRRHISHKAWRRVHLASYVGAWAATLHGILAGTDLANRLVAGTAVALLVGSTVAILLRVRALGRPGRDGQRRPSPLAPALQRAPAPARSEASTAA